MRGVLPDLEKSTVLISKELFHRYDNDHFTTVPSFHSRHVRPFKTPADKAPKEGLTAVKSKSSAVICQEPERENNIKQPKHSPLYAN